MAHPLLKFIAVLLITTGLLLACGGGGGGGSTTPAPTSTTFTASAVAADCAGANCAAISGASNTYAGTGTGTWQYTNTDSVPAIGDINIPGVSAGKTVTLIYSNSNLNTNASTTPSSGTLASPAAPEASVFASPLNSQLTAESNEYHAQHGHMLTANRHLALEMLKEKPPSSDGVFAYKGAPSSAPLLPVVAMEDPRIWNENGYTKTNYNTKAKRVCAAGTLGRKVVMWVQDSIYASMVTDTQLDAYQATFCGTNNNDGAYAKIANAIGDAWGSAVPSKYSATRIADTVSQKQDINIVIINPVGAVGSKTNWGGYFYALNNRLTSTPPSIDSEGNLIDYTKSNESLVFFINADQPSNYIQSVLIHELTHMINYYQRTVLNDDTYETWLEETTAMMTQDIFDPGLMIAKVSGSCLPTVCDLRSYATSGAGVSYFNWPTTTSNNHYYMGAAFGAFLNRRFGPNIYLQLATDCYTAPANTSGYTCLDMLIKNNGGAGIATEFARFGASVFGRMGGTGEPSNFGFPAQSGTVTLKTTNGAGALGTSFTYNIPAINNWWSGLSMPTATSLSTYTYSTHTYKVDTVASGKTSYVRTGVSVPAKTSLSVVVK